jgi:hypothetical protein
VLFAFAAGAEEPSPHAAPSGAASANADGLPSWAPGPMLPDQQAPIEGRVVARNLGLAFTLPKSWRADDVSWRELDATAAQSLNPIAESGLVVELADTNGGSVRLLAFYRVPLEQWRAAERTGKAGPGRIAIVDRDRGFVVVRPADAEGPGRFATLRLDLDDAIGTLALFDAHHDERHLLAKLGTSFTGTLADGSTVALQLETNGKLKLSFSKGPREVTGSWVQRDSQVIGQLFGQGPEVNPALLFHYDGVGLIVMKWDQKVFGNIGGRLDRPQ